MSVATAPDPLRRSALDFWPTDRRVARVHSLIEGQHGITTIHVRLGSEPMRRVEPYDPGGARAFADKVNDALEDAFETFVEVTHSEGDGWSSTVWTHYGPNLPNLFRSDLFADCKWVYE